MEQEARVVVRPRVDVVDAEPELPRQDHEHGRGDGEERRPPAAAQRAPRAEDRRDRDEQRDREALLLDHRRRRERGRAEHGEARVALLLPEEERDRAERGGDAHRLVAERPADPGGPAGERRGEEQARPEDVRRHAPVQEPRERGEEGDEEDGLLHRQHRGVERPGEAEGRALHDGEERRVVGVREAREAARPGREPERGDDLRLRRPERPRVPAVRGALRERAQEEPGRERRRERGRDDRRDDGQEAAVAVPPGPAGRGRRSAPRRAPRRRRAGARRRPTPGSPSRRRSRRARGRARPSSSRRGRRSRARRARRAGCGRSRSRRARRARRRS